MSLPRTNITLVHMYFLTQWILFRKRTAFGAFGGALRSLTANELGGIAAKAALKQLGSSVAVDGVIFGNVAQTSVRNSMHKSIVCVC
jgi:acetyl-CoA acetyltransferase